MKAEILLELAALGKELLEQDNEITAHPIFMVQRRKRIYGIADGYTDMHVWVDDDGNETRDPDDPEWDARECERVGFRDEWENVQPFFTRKSAKAHGEANAHNLGDWRVYVESAYQNYEWQSLRRLAIAAYEAKT